MKIKAITWLNVYVTHLHGDQLLLGLLVVSFHVHSSSSGYSILSSTAPARRVATPPPTAAAETLQVRRRHNGVIPGGTLTSHGGCNTPSIMTSQSAAETLQVRHRPATGTDAIVHDDGHLEPRWTIQIGMTHGSRDECAANDKDAYYEIITWRDVTQNDTPSIWKQYAPCDEFSKT